MLLVAAPLIAAAQGADPPVPVGRDPGGFAVAVIGRGVDYGDQAMAQRLARDGEGEIIGYDFIDDDRRPYGVGADAEATALVIREGQAATVVAIRADPTQTQSLARAIGYAAQSPATVIAIFAPISISEVAAVIAAAARKFPRHLLVLEAGDEDLDTLSPAPAVADNVLIVTSADKDGTLAPSANRGAAIVDLAVRAPDRQDWASAALSPFQSKAAVARMAALAMRLRAVEPDASASDLKRRIMALAAPPPSGSPITTRAGWIADPRRHFWLE
jgi:hypothetical protein